ncbi:hypothetical protein EYF80_049178 [Liparis tanakae]|uniref:Uncharacterized protein n=1 Tax=Liparis tanakae TaxID=230148 RepID=A0A4Z2FIQ4_9TELE|nr:hypothetical protein EYF80_049178 [Liparis tanakae]
MRGGPGSRCGEINESCCVTLWDSCRALCSPSSADDDLITDLLLGSRYLRTSADEVKVEAWTANEHTPAHKHTNTEHNWLPGADDCDESGYNMTGCVSTAAEPRNIEVLLNVQRCVTQKPTTELHCKNEISKAGGSSERDTTGTLARHGSRLMMTAGHRRRLYEDRSVCGSTD